MLLKAHRSKDKKVVQVVYGKLHQCQILLTSIVAAVTARCNPAALLAMQFATSVLDHIFKCGVSRALDVSVMDEKGELQPIDSLDYVNCQLFLKGGFLIEYK